MSAGDFQLKTAAVAEVNNVAVMGQLSRRRLSRAMEYIHANLAEGVRTEDVASAAGLSAFHFARAFKRTTGMTPYRFLVMARVERVKKLLRKSETCLAEIAVEAGFVDQSHMTNVFRRSTGMTPHAFRNAWTRYL
ncbi:MAG: helix-turn-helix transcriptional regulator [Betaproteobacteria bacterium]|nr:helix-turn-helix transcriptional regulator [Betaproteobacteria bacterium]